MDSRETQTDMKEEETLEAVEEEAAEDLEVVEEAEVVILVEIKVEDHSEVETDLEAEEEAEEEVAQEPEEEAATLNQDLIKKWTLTGKKAVIRTEVSLKNKSKRMGIEQNELDRELEEY